MRYLAVRLVLLAVIIAVVARVVPGIHVHGGVLAYLWLSVLFSVVNLFVGSILRLITFPLIVVTLGLFLIVINALMLAITAWLSSRLDIHGAGSALLGGLIIAVFGWAAELIFPTKRSSRRRRARQRQA